MQKVDANPGDAAMLLCQAAPRLFPICASLLLAGQRPLRLCLPLFRPPIRLRRFDFFPVGVRDEGGKAQIEPRHFGSPHGLRLLRAGLPVVIKDRREEVAARIKLERDAFHLAFHGTVNRCFDSFHLGDLDEIASDGNARAVAARLLAAADFETRVSRFLLEKARESGPEMPQAFLQRHAVVSLKPCVFAMPLGNGQKLLQIENGIESLALHAVEMALQEQPLVPYEADGAELAAQKARLLGRGIQSDNKGFQCGRF